MFLLHRTFIRVICCFVLLTIWQQWLCMVNCQSGCTLSILPYLCRDVWWLSIQDWMSMYSQILQMLFKFISAYLQLALLYFRFMKDRKVHVLCLRTNKAKGLYNRVRFQFKVLVDNIWEFIVFFFSSPGWAYAIVKRPSVQASIRPSVCLYLLTMVAQIYIFMHML
jgi:hypothetical protein